MILYKKKKRLLESKSLYIVFGNMYSVYKSTAPYWGIILIVCKITIFVANSVLRNYIFVRGVTLAVIIHVYFVLYNRLTPHPEKNEDKSDRPSIRCFMWTLYLIILRNEFRAGRNTNEQWLITILDVVVIIINSLVLGYFLFRIVGVYLKIYAPMIAKIQAKLANLTKKKKKGEETTQITDTQAPEKQAIGIEIITTTEKK